MSADETVSREPGFAPDFVATVTRWSPDSPELEAAYRLRFEVYCVDCGFLDAAQYPQPRETDIYDAESTHAFAYNRDNELVGYVRLVHFSAERRFPWQLHCRELRAGVELPAGELCAEVSRLMVRRDYRRRKTDLVAGVDTAITGLGSDDVGARRRHSPQIMLSMYRRLYQHSRQAGIRYWYAAMERPLARALHVMGFHFDQIGAEADYFGPVAPYLADLHAIEQTLASANPALLAWLREAERPRPTAREATP